MADWTDQGVQRRCISFSAFRLDGLADILVRCKGASVFDVGCNRGAVGLDLVQYGVAVVHGCDNGLEEDEQTPTIQTARRMFADIRSVESRFEFVDLTGGPGAVKRAFGEHYRRHYDVTLMLAVFHKLLRVMPLDKLLYLVDHLAHHTGKFFVWRGSREEKDEFEPVLIAKGFRRVHYSEICLVKRPDTHNIEAQPTGIWARDHQL